MAEKDTPTSKSEDFAGFALRQRTFLQKRKDSHHLQRGMDAIDRAEKFPQGSEENKKWRMRAIIEANIMASRITPPEALMAERIIWSDPADKSLLDDMSNPAVAMFVPLTFKLPVGSEKKEYRKSATLTWLGEMHDKRFWRGVTGEEVIVKKRTSGFFRK